MGYRLIGPVTLIPTLTESPFEATDKATRMAMDADFTPGRRTELRRSESPAAEGSQIKELMHVLTILRVSTLTQRLAMISVAHEDRGLQSCPISLGPSDHARHPARTSLPLLSRRTNARRCQRNCRGSLTPESEAIALTFSSTPVA